MAPLIEKWNLLTDEDDDLFPLLEVCASYIQYYTSHLFKSIYVGCVNWHHIQLTLVYLY